MAMLENILFISRNTLIEQSPNYQDFMDLFQCSYSSMKSNVSLGLEFEQTVDLKNIYDVTYNDVMRGLEAFAVLDYSLGNKTVRDSDTGTQLSDCKSRFHC